MSGNWVEACAADAVAKEDVNGVEMGGRSIAVYRAPDGSYYASDGYCTHEAALLADGFVVGTVIECPMHNGRFDIRTGEAKGAPACVNLQTFPVKVESGKVFIDLG